MTFTSKTFTGNKGLQLQSPLIFEQNCENKTGVDLPPVPSVESRLGGCAAQTEITLPGLTEPEAMRHYVRLSQKNHSIDAGLYPLGSCTMKHNPRLNEKMARLTGFADVHPLQPQQSVQGALGVMEELGDWLMKLTNMPAIALSPKAGAHGELCGCMAIRAAIEASGQLATRRRVLVPESAHGTNPATAALLGFEVDTIPAAADGRVDFAALEAKLGDDVAALMLTNPNTCGLFEKDIVKIADALHSVGGYFYCDGANFNAIVGKVRPGDLGIDAMHINLHKTFSTPHGGGGPGAGPTVLSARLAAYAPLPYLVKTQDGLRLIENTRPGQSEGETAFGRMTAFHGQMGMFTRALTYMLSHGRDGLRQVAEDAVLNANYILSSLDDIMNAPFGNRTMHEVLFDDKCLANTGVETLDLAKALIDEGYHPMTIYFPLVVHGAMLIEPTETESKSSLDMFIATLRHLIGEAQAGNVDKFKSAPHYTPRRRLDETLAARQPRLRYQPPQETPEMTIATHAAE